MCREHHGREHFCQPQSAALQGPCARSASVGTRPSAMLVWKASYVSSTLKQWQ
jgi:hypothetical protein